MKNLTVWKEEPAAAAKSLQSCPTLCDPMDSSPPGSSVHGILSTRILEWVAISFSNTATIFQFKKTLTKKRHRPGGQTLGLKPNFAAHGLYGHA